LEKDEVDRAFVKPFTDAAITKCHGREFVVTRKIYCGLAPFKTMVGDVVFVLDGGGVLLLLRPIGRGDLSFWERGMFMELWMAKP
jgi:hypothetical protein